MHLINNLPTHYVLYSNFDVGLLIDVFVYFNEFLVNYDKELHYLVLSLFLTKSRKGDFWKCIQLF